MTIQLNWKTPTKIVRWHNWAEQAVKKIVIFPDGVTEKQIRPAWWQPWANTIAYYPFNWDANDHKWSWTLYNLSTTWVTYTNQLSNWNYVATFAWTWQTNSAKAICSTFNIWNIPQTFSIWCKTSGNNAGSYWLNKWILIRSMTTSNSWVWNFLWTAYLSWWYWAEVNINWQIRTAASWNAYADNARHNIVWVYSWTTVSIYVDGNSTPIVTKTGTSSGWNTTYLYIWWNSDTYYGFNWDMSEFIIENKVRTTQEISDYYNLTKWNYWL